MDLIFQRIKDQRLRKIVGCIKKEWRSDVVTEKFNPITEEYSEYDRDFLWLLCYQSEESIRILDYIEANYKQFHQYLDSGFLKKMSQKGRFTSHMWEMVLFDMLSSSGVLIPKSAAGADIILKTPEGQEVQIEAIAPDDFNDPQLRATRPNYSEGNIFTGGGLIEDLERPILLRFIKGFDMKANKTYPKDKPLILAINTHKTVGLISHDPYIIRRVLFGLGYVTIKRHSDDSNSTGLQLNDQLNKPGEKSFTVGRFRDPKYKHISGVIYTSQNPIGLIPNGFGWSNYGVTYIPNPLASNKIDLPLDFFKKIICNEEAYQEIDEINSFKSVIK